MIQMVVIWASSQLSVSRFNTQCRTVSCEVGSLELEGKEKLEKELSFCSFC